jgi:hypothetical protein
MPKIIYVRSHRSPDSKWHIPASGSKIADREGGLVFTRCGRKLWADEQAVDEWMPSGKNVSRGPAAKDICRRCR